jgi:hypothetical protein
MTLQVSERRDATEMQTRTALGNPNSGDQAAATDSLEVAIDPGQDDVLLVAVAVCIDEMAHGGR